MKKLLGLLGSIGLLSITHFNVIAQMPQTEPLDDKDLGLCWLFGDDKEDTTMGEQGTNDGEENSEESGPYIDAENDITDQTNDTIINNNEDSDTNNNESSSPSSTASAASSSSDDDEIMPNAPQASSSSTSSSSTNQSTIIKEGFCKRLARRVFAPCIAGYVKIDNACTPLKQKLSACKTFTSKWGRVIFCTNTGRCLLTLSALSGYAIAIKLGLCNDHVGFEQSLETVSTALIEKISELYYAYKNNPPMQHDDL